MNYAIEVRKKAGGGISKRWAGEIVRIVLKKIKISRAEISVAFVGNQEIKKLNKNYRRKDKVTDVLSFTYQAQDTKRKKPLAGEIVICYSLATSQAKEHGWKVEDEIKMLLVHGLLHLAGYDHEKSLKEAKIMEDLQEKIIKFLK